MTLHRACPEHGQRVIAVITRGSHEAIECPEGHHSVRTWLIVDEVGRVIGRGFVDRPGDLVTGSHEDAGASWEDAPRPPPQNPCRNGHRAWEQKKSDGRWRCGECKRVKAAAVRLRRRIPEIPA